MAWFCQFYIERALYKILWRFFVRFDEVIKLQTAEFNVTDIILTDVQKHFNPNFIFIFLLVSWREKICYQVLWCFRQFSTNL